ncbi:hypothetical protein LVISKB_0363 [Levilactobacillus brevis KB290]|uniref:Uncharacterized protein n=1 Tax=Levilactobacillus brevis KB290 TaxID=1001583 RepID=M5AB27_LEVBR|nr:hypothetical protein LVISKB_0363 [Levilactobacillus brevis KB290]
MATTTNQETPSLNHKKRDRDYFRPRFSFTLDYVKAL